MVHFGSFLGKWGSEGNGDGQFKFPSDVAFAGDGTVFVVDENNNRVQYFTIAGSFLGKWGTAGTGPGQFDLPWGIAVTPSGDRAYVTDLYNRPVQYFRRVEGTVTPKSLGKIKALFK